MVREPPPLVVSGRILPTPLLMDAEVAPGLMSHESVVESPGEMTSGEAAKAVMGSPVMGTGPATRQMLFWPVKPLLRTVTTVAAAGSL